MGHLSLFVFNAIELLVYLFIFLIGLAFSAIVVLYLLDRFQTKSTLRRNAPVLARFRYIVEHMGEFFRQYFLAQDKEEICILAHACGVSALRQLKRKHARIVQANGKSVSMIELHPEPLSNTM